MRRTWWTWVALALLAAACTGTSAPETTTSSTTLPPPDPTVASTTTIGPPPSATTSRTEAPPPSTTVATVPPPEPPPYGGTVVYAYDEEPPTLNYWVPGGGNDIVRAIAQAIHAGAFDVNPLTYELEPDVLTELPTVANGGVTVNADGTMTVRYRIREEAQWADGVPISGNDFRFTYEKALELGHPDYAAIVPESVTAGPKAFTFTMQEPTLAHQLMFLVLVPEHQVAGTDFWTDWDRKAWVSAGPFVLDKYERGRQMLLVRNDNYWRTDPEFGTPLPYLDTVLIRFISETEELIDGYLSGEIDAADLPNHDEDPTRVLEAGEEILHVDSPIWQHLTFQFGANNTNEDSLNEHLEFRQAVAHAIDRRVLAALPQWSSTGNLLSSYVNAYLPEHGSLGWDRYEHDPDQARQLLADLCARLGRDCTANPPTLEYFQASPRDEGTGQAIAEMLREVGIDAEVRVLDASIIFGEGPFEGGFWDMSGWAWPAGPGLQSLVDFHDLLDPVSPPPIGDNYYRWGTPRVTDGTYLRSHVQAKSRLIDEHTVRFGEIVVAMDGTVDEAELMELIREAEEILAGQAIFIPLLNRGHFALARSSVVGGVVANPLPAGLLWNVGLWHRMDGQR